MRRRQAEAVRRCQQLAAGEAGTAAKAAEAEDLLELAWLVVEWMKMCAQMREKMFPRRVGKVRVRENADLFIKGLCAIK